MALGIVVELPPDKVIASLRAIDGGLARAEAKGVATGKAIEDAFVRSAREALGAVEKSTRAQEAAQDRAARAAAKAAADAERATTAAAQRAAQAQERAARQAAAAQSQAAREAAAAERAALRETEETARAITIAAERRAKERAAVETQAARARATAEKQAAAEAAAAERARGAAAKKVADDRARAQAALATTYKSIVGPAAEYREKLNQIIQLERQGAITGKQRAAAVANMQREMKQFSASQQGGVRGAVGSALSSQFGGAALAAGGVGVGVAAAKSVIELGDSYTTLSNKIRLATDSEYEMGRVRERLFESADDARVDVGLLTDVYSQMRLATKELGTSQTDLIGISELLAKATRGVTEANKSAGLTQFGQALTKGRLQAEELMSIMENIPKVAELLAQGMDMTQGELRKAAEAGKIGTQEMLDAIKRVGPQIEADFGKSAATSAESWTALKNQVLQTVGGFASQVNVAGNVSRVVSEIGSGLRLVGGLVGQQVELWKSVDKATGGYLGKLAKQPGILGQIEALTGRIATKRLFGAELIDIQTEAIKGQTAELEKNMRAYEDRFTAQVNAEQAAKRREALKRGKSYDKDWNEVNASPLKLAYGMGLDLLDKNKAKADKDATRRAMGLPTDDEIAAEGKAYREKIVAAYRSLEDGAFGVIRANRELAEAERDLDAAVRAGLTSREHAIEVLDLTRERLQEQLDPYQAIIDRLHGERAALSLDSEEQQRYADVRRVVLDLHRQGVELADEQIEALHREFEATAEANRALEAKRAILQSLRGPQEAYAEQMRAAGDLAAAGTISLDEYLTKLAELNPALVEFGTSTAEILGDAAAMVIDLTAASEDAAKKAEVQAKGLNDILSSVTGDLLTGGIDKLVGALGEAEFSLDSLKESFADLARSVLADLSKMLIKLLAFQAIKATIGVSSGTFGGALGAALMGGFAAGGSFTVPNSGGGGTDSVPVMFRATPGERVSIATPAQQQAQGRAAAPVVNVNPTIVFDPREALAQAIRSPGGHQMIIDVIASNPSAIRAALSR